MNDLSGRFIDPSPDSVIFNPGRGVSPRMQSVEGSSSRGGTSMVGEETLLVQLVRLVERIPEPPRSPVAEVVRSSIRRSSSL